ncbi:fructokinase [Shewanella woodyi]|uniref:ROK family protein n=1 Tax=Shewanella woodyi (strain ATCC 51908 / MS32) TaxID=392500 RepID=B1KES7_SHEWM|nr:fructokinase [Shewanella woodyi]ACA88092.1 ROK family protein [Shewanella woodyi ATCC 51908]
MLRIGVDLGGTKIEAVCLDELGNELFKKRIATPREYELTLDAIVSLVEEVEVQLGKRATVGVGIPGIISPKTGLVKNANATWINGHQLDKDLGARLGREVKVANDANCFAVSEAVDGAGEGKALVFGVIIGTGCGGGLAVVGRVHEGGNGLSGEWGHNPLPWMMADEHRSTQCFCGQHDCIETFISGTGFIRDYQQGGGEPVSSGCQIMALVKAGDSVATQAFERYMDRLARALAHIINAVDPDIIVLGGGMSNVDAIYPRLPRLLSQYVLGGECMTPVVKNRFGGSSGVRGAAWLWPA